MVKFHNIRLRINCFFYKIMVKVFFRELKISVKSGKVLAAQVMHTAFKGKEIILINSVIRFRVFKFRLYFIDFIQ